MSKDEIHTRKIAKSLSPSEKRNFTDAVNALKKNTKDNIIGDNKYDDCVIWHA